MCVVTILLGTNSVVRTIGHTQECWSHIPAGIATQFTLSGKWHGSSNHMSSISEIITKALTKEESFHFLSCLCVKFIMHLIFLHLQFDL